MRRRAVMDGLYFIWICLSCVSFALSDDYIFDDSVGLGRRFDGVGAISGGGATSKLLINYPEPQQSEILDLLFKPSHGASLQILKVEIGGDAQSSEGSEPSHMHEEWDENFSRGYEWWLMVEAKKRNPSIRLCALAWGFPGWLGGGKWYPYYNNTKTANYIFRWIWGAKTVYNLDIDCVGIWNEKPYEVEYIKVLRKTLDQEGFNHVKIIAADLLPSGAWEIVEDMKKDQQLNDSIAYIGAHYTGSYSTDDAKNCGKPLWSSEECADIDDEEGAGCMARLLNQNYLVGEMTSLIAWNLIASYYSDLPIPNHSLMTANEPWSGYYVVSPPIWATAHLTQFTEIGWSYLKHGYGVTGLKKGGSLVALISPNRKNFTIMIETMDTSSRQFCLRLPAWPTRVYAQNITIKLKGSLVTTSTTSPLHLWRSELRGNSSTVLFDYVGIQPVSNGLISLSLSVNSIYTLTTVATGKKNVPTRIPQSQPFPIPYKDNFDSYAEFQEAFNFAQQVGVFEIRESNDVSHGKVMQQTMINSPIHWCPTLHSQPIGVIGNYNWSDVEVAADMYVPSINGTNGVFLAVHVDQGGCTTFLAHGFFFFLLYNDQKFIISHDLARTNVEATGDIVVSYGQWYNMSLKFKGNTISASLDSKLLCNQTVASEPRNGFVALGTDNFGLANFDNLSIR